MSLFASNQNKSERIARLIISLFLMPTPFILECSTYAIVLGVLGGILFFNAIVGVCMIYKLFGVNTCNINPS